MYNRLETFRELMKIMNFTKTAEKLNMTQPAVSKHIKQLEEEFSCKLFNYENKKLSSTKEAEILLEFAKVSKYNEKFIREKLNKKQKDIFKIGATKSVGMYLIDDLIIELCKKNDIEIDFIIDNTKSLLSQIDNLELDFAYIEGYFHKSKYEYELYKKSEFLGICSSKSKLANKNLDISEIAKQDFVLRENGSGSRKIFDTLLKEEDYSISDISNYSVVSDIELIKKIVSKSNKISFLYEFTVKKSDNISFFRIKNKQIFKAINFVCLKNSKAKEKIERFKSLSTI